MKENHRYIKHVGSGFLLSCDCHFLVITPGHKFQKHIVLSGL